MQGWIVQYDGKTYRTVTTFSPLLQPILRASLTHATKFTALLEPRNRPSRCTRKRAILTASASVILSWPMSPVVSFFGSSDIRNTKLGRAPEGVTNHGKRELNVRRDTVDPDSLNDCIDLMSSSCALALLDVEHDTMLYLQNFDRGPVSHQFKVGQLLDVPCCKDHYLLDPQALRECHLPLI